MAVLGCGTHQVFLYKRGGVEIIGELFRPSDVRWNRVRDDISTGQVTVATSDCCELLSVVESVAHELHFVRDGEHVWQGVITRIEFGRDQTTLFAQDLLWVASRTALAQGYDYSYPNITKAGAAMREVITNQCYALYGDPWNMLPGVSWKSNGVDDARTSRAVEPYSRTVWEDFDKYAEDGGMDYVVINREVLFWDTNLNWNPLPDLGVEHIGEWPDVVEYGNELATRAVYTNNAGLSTLRVAPPEFIDRYGRIDHVTSASTENAGGATVSDTETVLAMEEQAVRELNGRLPMPVRVRMPSGTRLLPDAPWAIHDLVPGSMFTMSVVGYMCRDVSELHKLDVVEVTETQAEGESVAISSISAPRIVVTL